MDGRFTIANIAVVAGAKNGIFIPDSVTENYVKERATRKYKEFSNCYFIGDCSQPGKIFDAVYQ